MKLALVAVLLVAVASAEVLRFKSLTEVDSQWEDFKTTHGKKYVSEYEEQLRKEIFSANLKKIELHNYLFDKGVKSYTLGVNQFADMEQKEFVSMMNGFKLTNETRNLDRSSYMGISPVLNTKVPASVDWRKHGYVTPVKNQGQCGSCWAFSTTGSLEGQHFKKTGKLVSLSEQNLVDCSTKWGNHGCGGGLMDLAFQYIKDNDGIDTEKSYPYEGQDDSCKFKAKTTGATDTGFVDIPSGQEDKLVEAIASIGPISVAIDASQGSFQLYKSGVYDEPNCSSTFLDHGVLAVGYGTDESGVDYYIVKNSWDTTWGDKGYIMMSRNKNNQCGIASKASYPVV